jgi:DNA-binding winged helix-turn-helix (wHTH) protein
LRDFVVCLGTNVQFVFSDHRLDTKLRELRRGPELVAVEPQVFDLLTYLVQNSDRVVSKDDLIAAIWDGRIVSESTLTSRINAARKAVGDSGRDQRLIRTIMRKGFRFVGALCSQQSGDQVPDIAGPSAEGIDRPSRALLSPLDRPAIAVFPFTNMSGEPEQEYFAEGISEDIITALSKLRWFHVIARNSSFIYKGKAVHMKQVAKAWCAASSREACARTAIACESRRNSMTSPLAVRCGRSVTTAVSPTCSPCRTRLRKLS